MVVAMVVVVVVVALRQRQPILVVVLRHLVFLMDVAVEVVVVDGVVVAFEVWLQHRLIFLFV